MKRMSKKEMLILIDQIESAHWDLTELQRAYLPETQHADQDDRDAKKKGLRVGTGGIAYKAAYKAHEDEKTKRREEHGVTPPKGDGAPKYGYRKDLANMGPEHWDYLSPYMIFEPEARHLSHLDGAFKYEDRYVLWEEEHRTLSLAAKLQRMKMLGIPLEQAETMTTPDRLKRDHIFPNAKIRRALSTHLAKGKPVDAKEFWTQWHAQGRTHRAADAKLLARKEAKTVTAARRNIPEYIRRFEREHDMVSIDVGASTVLAQNLYLKSRIAEESLKPSLLTHKQQASAKALLGMMAQRNRLALKKMYLSTRNQWEGMMVERALEKKYLETYNTVGSDLMNSTTLLKLEQEVMGVVADYYERFSPVDWETDALNLRDTRLAQADRNAEYGEQYIKKMQEFMEANAELPDSSNVNAGGRAWINDMLDWEDSEPDRLETEAKNELIATETAELDRELDSWNEFFDVQVAEELGHMLDAKELVNEDRISDGAVELAEMRVSKRLNATRQEWKAWKLRPQYTDAADMYAPPADPIRAVDEQTEVDNKKSPGMRIVERVLKADPLTQASAKWKARMAPKFADLDRAEGEERPGTTINQLNGGGEYEPVASVASGSGPAVDGAVGAGVGGFDPSLSSAGHRVLDMDDPAERRLAVAHSKTSTILPESLRGQLEDPMLQLLNEHAANSRDGRNMRVKAPASTDDGENGSGDRNAFSTINPRLGFPDDDFRLYDPVLTKTVDKSRAQEKANSDESDESHIKSATKRGTELRKNGVDILNDDSTDPVYWIKKQDQAHRRKHFLDLDPFGPPNTDERRDFDDQYMHADEEDYAFKKRIDPETNYARPLTQQIRLGIDETPVILKYDLNDETCELLYMLHRSDPVKYTPRFLAHKFQLSAQRVKSTLILQAIHHRMVANGVVHPLMMEYSEERALEDLIKPSMHMIHETPEMVYQFLPDYRWVREDDLHRVLSEQQSIEDRFLSRSDRLDKAEQHYYAKWGAIGVEIPKEPTVQPLLDERLMAPTRHNVMLVDISELPAARYTMGIRHRDGTLREPNEETYQFARKREKGNSEFTYVKYHQETATPM